MKTINEILKDYTAGEATLEETNEALKKSGGGYHLEPFRNTLTEEEIQGATIGTDSVMPTDGTFWIPAPRLRARCG